MTLREVREGFWGLEARALRAWGDPMTVWSAVFGLLSRGASLGKLLVLGLGFWPGEKMLKAFRSPGLFKKSAKHKLAQMPRRQDAPTCPA